MGMDMYLLVPWDQKDMPEPSIEEDLKDLTKLMNEGEKNTEKKEGEDDDNTGYRGRNRQSNPVWAKAVGDLHSKWVEILAWSHGASGSDDRSNVQDISVTRWVDRYSPAYFQAVAGREKFPFVIVRCLSLKEGKYIYCIEMKFKNVQISSCSTGGSGGEDRFTENITFTFKSHSFEFYKVDPITGEKLPGEFGFTTYDQVTKKGNRNRLGGDDVVPSLLELSKQAALSVHLSKEDKVKLDSVPSISDFEKEGLDDDSASASPRDSEDKAKFYITTDVKSKKYKKIECNEAKRESLLNVIAKNIGKNAGDIKGVYTQLREDLWVEICTDEDVEELAKPYTISLLNVEI